MKQIILDKSIVIYHIQHLFYLCIDNVNLDP
jgi:hypothetical protein